jgi:adenosine deaminase
MADIDREFVQALPKTDLHVHLDGSMRIPTLIELAKQQDVKLPSDTEEGLRKVLFKDSYADLGEYLEGFSYTAAVMQDGEALERIAYEFALDCFADGVLYCEVRLAPQRHMSEKLGMDDVLKSVNDGFHRAKKEINSSDDIASGKMPHFDYGIIVCAMRKFEESYSDYFRRVIVLNPNIPILERFKIAASDLVRGAIRLRDEGGLPLVAFDLAGEEAGYPAADYADAYDLAHKAFMMKTVHAGEAYGPASIFQAITECHADRIGHGTNLFRDDMVDLPTEQERKHYVRALWQYIADRRITIEVCLTSNMQTIPGIKRVENHPAGLMLDNRLSTTFCTDNRLISNTTVTKEVMLAIKHFHIAPRRLRDIIIYGFKRSFYAGAYLEKRSYVRKIIDFYDEVQRRFEVKNDDEVTLVKE